MQTMQEYKCPCCGGAIAFDSSLQKMKCPYCDTEFEMEALKGYDEALKNNTVDAADEAWQPNQDNQWGSDETDGLGSYVCQSCGGEIIADSTTGATSCPYCGNPVVFMGQFSGALRPDFVIPFKLDKKAAKEGLMKHLSGKRLLPKVFKDQNHIDEIKGIYVPFWLFDADVTANINYDATTVRRWSDSDYDYTETSYYLINRAGNIGFEHIPADGSSKMPDDLMESIEPFNFGEAVPFQTAYLAGYLADKYDVTAEQSVERADRRVKSSTEQMFAQTAKGYATLIPKSSSISKQNAKTNYALYPVWILNTTWNGNKYTFAMNGQTGKFVGDLPCDKKAALIWFFALGAGISALIYLLMILAVMFGIL